MNIPRFFVKENQIDEKVRIFFINEIQDIKKIHSVLRMQIGDEIELLNNSGFLYKGRLDKISPNMITGNIIEKKKIAETNKPHVILAQALTKSAKIDSVIRMNTEIGVDEFVIFESKHSIVPLKKFKSKKLDRWEKIAKEAARQSERPVPPQIHPPIKFEKMLEIQSDKKILLHSREAENSKNYLDLISEAKEKQKVLIVIGPEGGFSDQEIQKALEKGFSLGYLKLPILRTQTAGVVAASLLLAGH